MPAAQNMLVSYYIYHINITHYNLTLIQVRKRNDIDTAQMASTEPLHIKEKVNRKNDKLPKYLPL